MNNKFFFFLILVNIFLIILTCSQPSKSGGGNEGRSKSDNKQTTPDKMVFVTSGDSFTPVITVTGSPEILWTWADGTTSNSNTPVKNYGSAGSRINKLKVTPWSALIRINIGYDAEDGGSGSIEFVADQHVTSVQGLEIVAPYLRQWCSSYNEITSLDFSNFIHLDTIECYLSQSLVNVNLRNTPALQRACFEDCNLSSLDLSQSSNLQDLRGAQNNYNTINFGSIGSHVWHICIRDNPQITNRNMFADMSLFPNIAELFIWNGNQTGSLNISSTSPNGYVYLAAPGNQYTSANFTGALQNSSGNGNIDLSYNQLTSLIITNCSEIISLNANHNNLNSDAVDSILHTLDTLGRTGGMVDLTFNTPPGADGLTYITNLRDIKGWTVNVD
jgi:hypothetical protein